MISEIIKCYVGEADNTYRDLDNFEFNNCFIIHYTFSLTPFNKQSFVTQDSQKVKTYRNIAFYGI